MEKVLNRLGTEALVSDDNTWRLNPARCSVPERGVWGAKMCQNHRTYGTALAERLLPVNGQIFKRQFGASPLGYRQRAKPP
jgi:hypothetical protein